jgi:hypothetical protein
MTEPRGLIGLGLAGQLAKRLGVPSRTGDSNLAGGNGFANAIAIGQFQFYVRANSQTSARTYIMTSVAEVGSEYQIFNIGGLTGGTTADIYPPSGGTFNVNGGATATMTQIATGKGIMLVAITASTFDAFLTA